MNILLIILAIIVIIVLVALIIAAFAKKDYGVDREININKPKREVFNYIKYLKNQHNYSKWTTMDPNMKKTFTGTDAAVGFVSAWESENKNVGKGEQEITKIIDGEKVEYQIRFVKPFTSIADAYMTTMSGSNKDQTKVRWGFKSRMKYPMNLMLLFMDMNKMIGNDFETGLSNLKKILEHKKREEQNRTPRNHIKS